LRKDVSAGDIDQGRRGVLQTLVGGLGAVTIIGIAPLAGGCEISRVNNAGGGDITVDVASLAQDNDALVTARTGPDGAPVLVVRISVDTFRALSMRCTHLGCTVNAPASERVTCSCHGSAFALDGTVITGPAAIPLHAYQTTYDPTGRTLTIHTS